MWEGGFHGNAVYLLVEFGRRDAQSFVTSASLFGIVISIT